jgi:hypothetical protein
MLRACLHEKLFATDRTARQAFLCRCRAASGGALARSNPGLVKPPAKFFPQL